MKKSLLLLIFICSLCALQGGGCGSSAPPPPQISVNLTPGSNQALDVNQSVALTANVVNDTSGQGVTWTVACPAGVAACGAMAQPKSTSGAPDNFVAPANVGAAEMVTVTATSVSDPSQSKSVLVTVNPAFALVSPAPAQPQPGNVGALFSFNLMSFVQGGTPPFTWSVKSGTLPAGLTLNPSTGMVTGTPTAKASATAVSFNCTDSGIPPVSTPASVQISLAVNPGILVINQSSLPGGTLRAEYGGSTTGLSLTGSGGLTPYKWTWAAAAGSSLPPGLSLSSNADNTASIAGVPTAAATYNVVVSMTDSESPATTPATANYTIALIPPAPLVISSAAPPTGHVGAQYYPHIVRVCLRYLPGRGCIIWQNQTHYGYSLLATGGVGARTWTWASVAPSTLPPGLTLAGVTISGTPPIAPATAGTYNVSVTVTDSGIPPVQTTTNYPINIQNPPVPVINTTPAPLAGAINLPYSFTFTASQGLPSLTLTWSETGTPVPGLGLVSPAGVLSGTPSATGTFPITIGVQDSLLQNATAQAFNIQIFPHGFKATGSMATPRYCHTATLLGSGKVLVTGGNIGTAGVVDPTATAELYDPTSGSFSPTGSLATARACATATLLSNGKVLVTGGYDATDNFLASSELYDPASGSFSPTGAMGTGRFGHTATLLNSGKVLVVGGSSNSAVIATAELYDPGTGSFSPTGSMPAARFKHTATLLRTGKVLVAGGADVSQNALATTELYDPASGSFSPSGTMGTARFNHTATFLCDLSSPPCTDSRVLVTGGTNTTGAELYDPVAGSFTGTGSMGTARSSHTATLLKDGTVLVTGGQGTSGNIVAQSAELFDPTTGSFAGTGSMATPRNRHTATLLQNGKALVTGGDNGTTAQATAELYQ